MTTSPSGRRGARALLVGAAAALATALAAAPAGAAGVTLEWSSVNAYTSGCSATGVNCTWAGYVTNPTPGAGARGTASPIAPATGPTLTPTSPRGADQAVTWSLPAVSGSISVVETTGAMEFDGGVSFVSPAPPAGHGFTITLEDPRLVFNNDGGLLYASGLTTPRGAPAPVAYDRTQPVFVLRGATWSINADGSTTLTAAPEIAVRGYAFPADYDVSDGPDRSPNTFGSFTIKVPANVGPVGPKGDKGDKGDTGAAGRNGTNGANGRDGTTRTIRIQTSSLARAPFKGKAARKVRVTARGSSRTLATGTVKGRKLTITLARGVGKKQLKGRYVLRLTGGKRGSAVVRLP